MSTGVMVERSGKMDQLVAKILGQVAPDYRA